MLTHPPVFVPAQSSNCQGGKENPRFKHDNSENRVSWQFAKKEREREREKKKLYFNSFKQHQNITFQKWAERVFLDIN